jgi:predicted O-methyltransferase YrrM
MNKTCIGLFLTMIQLKNITLFCLDGRTDEKSYIQSSFAVKQCLSHVEFGDCIFLSAYGAGDKSCGYRKIDPISTREYNMFMSKELNSIVNTDYVLVIQHDGFILNPDKWDNRFLEYDYIGAPWSAKYTEHADRRVGNGGFSLRSKKFLEACEKDFEGHWGRNEDWEICVVQREFFESRRIKFAPVEVASKFSMESHLEDCDNDLKNKFGFHGYRHFEEINKLYKKGSLGMNPGFIRNKTLDKIDMSASANKIDNEGFRPYYTAPSSKEHYRLLTYLSSQFNNSIFLDIGTHRGCSALALAANPTNKVYSFDLTNKLQLNDIPHNIDFIFNNVLNEKYEKLLSEAALIFVDVTPHDGIFEKKLYTLLKKVEYKGILILDDISHEKFELKKFWNEIADEKYNITHLGHHSGTGWIDFEPNMPTSDLCHNIKVIGFMPLHYGAEYLKLSLESILPVVEKMVVAYTRRPSYGHGQHLRCPETRDELFKICREACGDKLIWDEQGTYNQEGDHRNCVFKYTKGYDLVLCIDSDEVFKTEDLPQALKIVYNSGIRNHGINGYVNFWRSFDYICEDAFRPIRVCNLNAQSGTNYDLKATIYHFGCCQNDTIMKYKYQCHGHKNEIRGDWVNDVYFKWTPENNFGDVHPVATNLWNPKLFDKTTLPNNIKNHPNYYKLSYKLNEKPKITIVNVEETKPGHRPWLVNGLEACQSHTIDDSFDLLKEKTKDNPIKIIIEIGTCYGGFSLWLHDKFNLPVYTFDIVDYGDATAQYIKKREFAKFPIVFYLLDCFSQEATNKIKELIKKGRTLIVCDGGNKAKEFNLYNKMLKTNDIIIAHDYAPDSEYFHKHIKDVYWNYLEVQNNQIDLNKTTPFLQNQFIKSGMLCRKKNP